MQLQIFSLLVVSALAVPMTDPREKSTNEVKQQRLIPSSRPVIPALIDSLRQHYLALETDLWHLMDSGIDTAYVLEQMNIVHITFFGEKFREFNITFDDYAIDRHSQLVSIFGEINRTISMVMKSSLHQNPLAFDEISSIDAARHQLDLTHQIDTLHDIAGSKDFYETIKNVSDFLFKRLFRCRCRFRCYCCC